LFTSSRKQNKVKRTKIAVFNYSELQSISVRFYVGGNEAYVTSRRLIGSDAVNGRGLLESKMAEVNGEVEVRKYLQTSLFILHRGLIT
jgi:hypothetical protein